MRADEAIFKLLAVGSVAALAALALLPIWHDGRPREGRWIQEESCSFTANFDERCILTGERIWREPSDGLPHHEIVERGLLSSTALAATSFLLALGLRQREEKAKRRREEEHFKQFMEARQAAELAKSREMMNASQSYSAESQVKTSARTRSRTAASEEDPF